MRKQALLIAFTLAVASAYVRDAFAQSNAPLAGELKAGPYAVGFKTIYREDRSRTWQTTRKYGQAFAPDRGGRPIRISVWYPAAPATGRRMTFKNYVSPIGPAAFAELNHIIELRELENVARVPPGKWQELLATRVNASLDAVPARGRFPLLLYAGSLDSTSTTYVFVAAEFLASHGYVVATVPLLGPTNENADEGRTAADRQRAAEDLEFTWSVMRGLPNVDDSKLGVFGKSLGGIAAVIFAMRNANVSAVIGLDATYGFKGNERLLTELPAYSPANMRAAFLDIRRDWDDRDSVLDLSAEHGFRYSDRSFVMLKGMNHYDFDADAMLAYHFHLPIGPNELVNPGRTRETAARGYGNVCRMMLDFFDDKLKRDPSGRQRLANDVTRSDGVWQHEDLLPPPPSALEFAAIISKQGFEAATAIVDRYRREVPGDPIVDQTVFNDAGYRLLAAGSFDEAIGLMRLIVYVYPDSANAADSLADAYIAAGEIEQARAALHQALALIARDSSLNEANKQTMAKIEQAKLDQLKP